MLLIFKVKILTYGGDSLEACEFWKNCLNPTSKQISCVINLVEMIIYEQEDQFWDILISSFKSTSY